MFKDALEGFELSIRIEIFEREKWASFTKGAVGPSTPRWKRRGGRDTLFRITDEDLCGNDDLLMVLLPWRQEGNELGIRRMFRFPYAIPDQHKCIRYRWSYGQRPHRREYR